MNRVVTLRPITAKDRDFLYRVYASTREDELAPLGWDAAQKESFLEMQFAAQHEFYQEQFPGAEFQIILLDGESVGRLYVDRQEDEIRILDVALLPEHRNRGIGSALLGDVLADGERAGLPVRIHVERYNPALSLYNRLGFHKIGEGEVYFLLEWSPEGSGRE
jgi:ribosomal protein S18 acetylase RimI-like enzyme